MAITLAPISRRRFFAGVAAATLAAGALTGCSTKDSSGITKVTIGTLSTEDFLPMWVAEAEGLFNTELMEVEIVTFQSATELQAGIKSGQVDLAMTDPMVSAGIFASGTTVSIQWITLGTDASQGRFGIMVNAENYEKGISSLKMLAGVPIGVGSNTILEYVMDSLMLKAGVPAKSITKMELQKLPLRFQNMMDGVVTAAALPGSLLALGEAKGAVCIADDTTGDNISQSVMIARKDFLDADADGTVIAALKAAWDEAVGRINATPEAYRNLLIEKANLNEVLADSYPISTYPTCQLPTAEMIDPVLTWMQEKGYLEYGVAYNPETGAFLPAV